MKPRSWKLLSAAMAMLFVFLACGNPYNGPTTTPEATSTPLNNATEAVSATPTLLSTLSTATLSISSLATPNGTQIAAGTPASEWINDAYGGRSPEAPDAPFTEAPNMSQPLSGHTYEPRPVYVFTDAPSCSAPAQGQTCGVWASAEQSWVDGYVNEWQPAMPQRSVRSFNGGLPFTYDHEDASYYYMTLATEQMNYTFAKSQVTLVAPVTNAQMTLTTDTGPIVRPVHYWLVNVYAPWGPHASTGTSGLDHLTVGTWTTVYSWGIDAQYSLWWACDDADQASTNLVEPDYAKCFLVAKPDFLPYKFLGRVPDAGGWFQSTDGQTLYATWQISEYFRDGFWHRTTGSTTYPYQ